MEVTANTEKEIIFHQEKFEDVYTEMLDLLYRHYKEIAHYQDIKINPDIEGYLALQRNNFLRIYTIRESGQIIGYGVYFVKTNLHYKDSLQAHQDVLYIRKDKRGFGRKFIKWCDDRLREEGVQVIYHHVKTAHDWSPMLEGMNYDWVEKIYCKRLDV